MSIIALLFALVTEPAIARLSADELHELVQNDQAVVVDVRGSIPYALGHIEGAVWMPLGLIPERAGELPHDKLIVTYCTCPREDLSLAAASALQKEGFERVAVLVGGHPAWTQAGYPTASTRERAPAEESAAGGTASGGRLAPPVSIACDRNELTSYAGPVTHYRRLRGKTVVAIDSESGAKTVTLRHRGTDNPSSSLLIGGKAFADDDWERIEARKGELRPAMGAIAWVCRDGRTIIDWRPGMSDAAAK